MLYLSKAPFDNSYEFLKIFLFIFLLYMKYYIILYIILFKFRIFTIRTIKFKNCFRKQIYQKIAEMNMKHKTKFKLYTKQV